MTTPITTISLEKRIQLHPEVGGLPPDASNGNILMFLAGEVAWGDADDLSLESFKITDGNPSETSLEVSSLAPELLARFAGVQNFRMLRNTSLATPAIVLEATGGDVLDLRSAQDVQVNGSSLVSAIIKLTTIAQGAQVNYTNVNVNSEATPVDVTGNSNVLALAGVNSLSDALASSSTFPNLSSENRSYSPRNIVSIISNFSPPKFDFARDTTTTPNAIRSFSTNDVLTAVQYLQVEDKAASLTSYDLKEADSGKLLRFTGTSSLSFRIPTFTTMPRTGFYVIIEQAGVGKITVSHTVPANLTNVYGAYKTYGKGALVLLIHEGNNVWNLSGAVGL
jgi:hypothetical protein